MKSFEIPKYYRSDIISRIKETISSNGGEVRDVEDWGRKRLAYMVNKNKIGYYAIFRFNALPDIISKLERFYKLEDNILRYLTIKLSKGALEQVQKMMILIMLKPKIMKVK